MERGTSLKDWLFFSQATEKQQQVFYQLDQRMKQLHQSGYFVSSFGLDAIFVSEEGRVSFAQVEQGPTREDMQRNIYQEALVAIGAYTQCGTFLTPSFLEEHFEEVVSFVPSEDVPYYKSVILDHQYHYYSDYRIALENQASLPEQDTISNDGAGVGLGYVKSTAAGRAFSEEEVTRPGGVAAFVNVLVLPTLLILSSFLTTLVLILIALGK